MKTSGGLSWSRARREGGSLEPGSGTGWDAEFPSTYTPAAPLTAVLDNLVGSTGYKEPLVVIASLLFLLLHGYLCFLTHSISNYIPGISWKSAFFPMVLPLLRLELDSSRCLG